MPVFGATVLNVEQLLAKRRGDIGLLATGNALFRGDQFADRGNDSRSAAGKNLGNITTLASCAMSA